jgi:GNAT superfamily N-acetyltransferase
MEILRAGPEDAEALSEIAFAAKRYWGYPEHWMERWRADLTVSPGFVRDNETYMAVVGDTPAGFYALVGRGRTLELEHLWVSPDRIGSGVGRALFEHAMRRASELGASTVEIEADPNAEGFYRRMGAWTLGERVYEMDGERRALPLLAVEVPDSGSTSPEP